MLRNGENVYHTFFYLPFIGTKVLQMSVVSILSPVYEI